MFYGVFDKIGSGLKFVGSFVPGVSDALAAREQYNLAKEQANQPPVIQYVPVKSGLSISPTMLLVGAAVAVSVLIIKRRGE